MLFEDAFYKSNKQNMKPQQVCFPEIVIFKLI